MWKRITCSVVSGVRVRARARVRVRVRVRVRAIFRGSGWGELHRRVRRDLLGLQLGEVGEHAREGRVHLAGCEGGGVVFGPRAAAAIPPRCQFDLVAAPRALHRHEGLVGLALAVARPREALRALGPHVDGRRLPRRQPLLLLLRRRSHRSVGRSCGHQAQHGRSERRHGMPEERASGGGRLGWSVLCAAGCASHRCSREGAAPARVRARASARARVPSRG